MTIFFQVGNNWINSNKFQHKDFYHLMLKTPFQMLYIIHFILKCLYIFLHLKFLYKNSIAQHIMNCIKTEWNSKVFLSNINSPFLQLTTFQTPAAPRDWTISFWRINNVCWPRNSSLLEQREEQHDPPPHCCGGVLWVPTNCDSPICLQTAMLTSLAKISTKAS